MQISGISFGDVAHLLGGLHLAGLHSETLAGLNPLDWALVVLLASSAFFAFLKGFLRSVALTVGVLSGIVLAAWYAPTLSLWLNRWVNPPMLAEVLAFLGIVLAGYVASLLLGRLLRGACEAVGLGLADRIAGAAFGIGRAVLLLSIAVIPASPFLPMLPFARNSKLLPYLQTAAHGISWVMPQNFGGQLAAGARTLQIAPPSRASAWLPEHATKPPQATPQEGEQQ